MTSILDVQQPTDPMQKAMMAVKDSTVASAAGGAGGGYVIGMAFSLFGSMISAETSTQSMGTADFFRYSVRNAHRMAVSFAAFGFVFGGLEVALEKRRGRKDQWNPTMVGGLLGGAYGWRSYKSPGLVAGLTAGAVLSLAFEKALDKMGMSSH